MDWDPGVGQTGYLIARISQDGMVTLPAGGVPLPPNATSYVDLPPFGHQFDCYVGLPLVPSGIGGLTDLLCIGSRGLSPGGAPRDVGVSLRQSTTATLAWEPPFGIGEFALVALPLDGSLVRVMPVSGGAASAADETGGVPICYFVVGLGPTGITPQSHLVCAVPGVATL